MGLNIDNLIRAGDVEIQHRIRRYDVKWGRPHFAVTYKRLMLAKMPIFYCAMEKSDYGGGTYYSRNWGSLGRDHDLLYYPTNGAGLTWIDGQPDPTDNAVNFSGVGYAQAIPNVANSALTMGYSIVIWFKPNVVLSNGTVNGLICKQSNFGVTSGGICSIHLEGNAGANRLAIHLNDGNVVYTDPADVVFEADKWYCAILTCAPGGLLTDPSQPISEDNPRQWVSWNPMVLYVNGVSVLEITTTPNAPDLTTNNCKWLVGATRQNGSVVYRFNGSIDEVGVFPQVFNAQTAAQIYGLGLAATYLEPDEDFDNDVVGSYADQRLYSQVVMDDSPTNYWPMDVVEGTEIVGETYKYVEDRMTGLYAKNMRVAYNSSQWNSNRIVDSPILPSNYSSNDPPGKALRMSGDSYPGYIADYKQWIDTGEQTVEFWYKGGGNSSHYDGIIGLRNIGGGAGFGISVKSDDGIVITAYWGDSSHFLTTYANMVMDSTTWYHVVATLNKYGEARLYINGMIVDSQSWGASRKYMRIYTSDLYVGGWGGDPHNTQPPFSIDDIALYSKALSANQVYNHYWTGKIGPYAKVSLTGGDPLQDPSPFVIGTNEYSELINEEDITEFVEAYSFDDDIKQLVPTASMTVYEDWGVEEINTKLNANTYVIIERRFLSQSLNSDSGWLSMGHFLVEGPIGSSYSAQGARVSNVALKGLAKLFSLDLAHTPIEPDRLLVKKRKFDIMSATVEYTKYKMARNIDDPDPEHVYQNWAEFPSVKLWVTDFKNYDQDDGDKGGISDPKEVIRIKGTEGAVRVFGGEGSVTVDNTYLLDKVSNNGLGDPSTVMGEFYRYATVEDVDLTTVVSLEVIRNRWRVGVGNILTTLLDGKSFLVKTGRAKGKLWKLVAIGGNRYVKPSTHIGVSTTLTNVALDTATGNWTKVSSFDGAEAPPNPPGETTPYAAQAWDSSGDGTTFKYVNIPLTTTIPVSSVDWSDNSIVKSIRVKVYRRGRYKNGLRTFENMIRDNGMRVRVGSLYTIPTKQEGYWPSNNTLWAAVDYGGEGQTLGVNWTWGSIKDYLNDTSLQFSVIIARSLQSGTSRTGVAEIYKVTVELEVEDYGVVTLHDIHGYPVHPEFEGLEVGDTVQIGDYNAVDDSVRKAAYRCGFQENNPSKPFYFELNPCPSDLAPSVPPVRPKIGDQTYWGELVGEILQYGPPNYRLAVNNEGVLRGKLVGFLEGALPTHTLIGRLDLNEDHGDYGIATRLIIEGEASDSFNIGLNSAFGGTSAVRAYTLEGYADPTRQPDRDDSLGITLTQDEADAIWQQVFNGNPKTPVPTALNDWGTRYGVILAKEGSPKDVKRWAYEDTALCAIDIGRSSTGTPIEIEALEFTWINHYLEGNTITQSLIVHYMTETDYEAEFGSALEAIPNQDDMSYFPPANSRAWTLLVDEFALQEGNTTIETSDFEGGLPVGVRFLKFTCGQAHYRFPAESPSDQDAAVRVTMAECKIWTSRRIIATAELGVSGVFGTGDYKELATRLRRRTDYLEKNLYLNDYDKAKAFAIAELRERYVDFTPIAVTCFAPTVQVADIVYLVHPETRRGNTYLVVAASQDMTGVGKFQVLNYDIST